jgi:uncharacterized OB-fold protein
MRTPYAQSKFNETKCPICGKLFYPQGEWAYFAGTVNKKGWKEKRRVCSWSCVRKYEKEHPAAFKWKGHEI